jgi:hypothetical protein
LLSHQKKKERESGDRFVDVYLQLWLTSACCCQPAVAGGFIYADLRSELNTHLAPQALFILSSPGCDPLSFGVFLPPPLLQAFPLLVAGHVLPLLPSLGQIVYLQFHEGLPLPRFGAQDALPSLLCVFFVTVAYYSVFSFFPGWSQSVQGAMLIWPRVICGT